MSTIIKTGCTLLLATSTYDMHDSNLPPFALREHGEGHIVHGDLHSLPCCAILHMPPQQIGSWRDVHGQVTLIHDEYFFRKGCGDFSLVLPIQKVKLDRDEIGEYEWEQWLCHGGEAVDPSWLRT